MTTRDQLPAPSGLGAVLSIVQAVVALVPRWLVVAVGVVFLTWLSFELYLTVRQKIAQTVKIEAESRAATMQIPSHAEVRALMEKLKVEREQKQEKRGEQ